MKCSLQQALRLLWHAAAASTTLLWLMVVVARRVALQPLSHVRAHGEVYL